MIADQYDNVFKDGKLTILMAVMHGDKQYHSSKIRYPLYTLLKSFLANYDIHMGGAVQIDDWQVNAVTIKSDFNIQNEIILKELYAFNGSKVNIQLSTNIAQDCAFAFDYDLKSYTCTLEKYVHGATVESTEYPTLEQMLMALKKREADWVED